MTELEKKRLARRRETAEDFTPEWLINQMLDKLPEEVWAPEKIFLDNSAGNGNMLICVLVRKLSHGHDPLQALSTIYGVELMSDNVEEMKQRLLDTLPELDDTQKQQAIDIINHNIVCHDALTWDYENWKAPANLKPKALF
jgi:hypothetical protein